MENKTKNGFFPTSIIILLMMTIIFFTSSPGNAKEKKLRITENNRFLEYTDGAPFFLPGRYGLGAVPPPEQGGGGFISGKSC